MPVYNARSTAIQLSTGPLHTTTTRTPCKWQCSETTAILDATLDAFSEATHSQTLHEHDILDNSGSRLRFLGKCKDMPFVIVHAGAWKMSGLSSESRGKDEERSTISPWRKIKSNQTTDLDNDQCKIFPASRVFEGRTDSVGGMLTKTGKSHPLQTPVASTGRF